MNPTQATFGETDVLPKSRDQAGRHEETVGRSRSSELATLGVAFIGEQSQRFVDVGCKMIGRLMIGDFEGRPVRAIELGDRRIGDLIAVTVGRNQSNIDLIVVI